MRRTSPPPSACTACRRQQCLRVSCAFCEHPLVHLRPDDVEEHILERLLPGVHVPDFHLDGGKFGQNDPHLGRIGNRDEHVALFLSSRNSSPGPLFRPLLRSLSINFHRARLAFGSRPVVGSSRKSISGSLTIDNAIPSLRFSPPESFFDIDDFRSERPTRSMRALASLLVILMSYSLAQYSTASVGLRRSKGSKF